MLFLSLLSLILLGLEVIFSFEDTFVLCGYLSFLISTIVSALSFSKTMLFSFMEIFMCAFKVSRALPNCVAAIVSWFFCTGTSRRKFVYDAFLP